MMGVRYFDLRLAIKKNTEDIYFVHGLYAEDVRGPLNEIKSFLETHPREVRFIRGRKKYVERIATIGAKKWTLFC